MSRARGGRLAIGAGTTLTAVAASPRDRGAPTRRWPPRPGVVSTPQPPQHGHARRQRLRGHALQLLQPVLPVAEGGQLLHEEGRRDLPGGAGQLALLGGVRRPTPRRCCGAWAPTCAWSVPTGERVIPIAALYQDDGIQYLAKRPDEVLTDILLPRADGAALRCTSSCGGAAPSTSRCWGRGGAAPWTATPCARPASCWARWPRCRARPTEAAGLLVGPAPHARRHRRRRPTGACRPVEAARQHRPDPSVPQEDDAGLRGARCGWPAAWPGRRHDRARRADQGAARRAEPAAAPARREGRPDPEHAVADRVGTTHALAAYPGQARGCAGRVHRLALRGRSQRAAPREPRSATTRWCPSTARSEKWHVLGRRASSRVRSGR